MQGKPEILGENPVPMTLCLPQISQGLAWDQTQASVVRSRHLIAYAMALSGKHT